MTPKQKSLLQVNAFKSIYAQLRRIGEKSIEECFVEAIVVTSDDYFERAMERNPELIENWLKLKVTR